MLRGAKNQPVLGGVGDTFTMAMYLPDLGDYLILNRIIAFEHDRRIAWEPAPGNAETVQQAGLPVGEGDATIVTETFDCTEAARGIREDV